MLLVPAALDVMIARLNVIALDQQPDPSLFATALVCSISAERDQIEICSAGHPPPVLMSATGAAHEAPLLPGPPLGIFADGRWQTSREALHPGTSVLVYTDGLVEGRVAPGAAERLGIDRLLEQLPRLRHAADDHLLAELADHAQRANGAPLADDVAALLLTPTHSEATIRD
jgi:serine phosphatase RsbU (regulator of sigma subunit)